MDVAIIGGGPIGIACGIEAQKRGLSYLIIEKGSLNNSIRKFPVNLTFFSTPEMLELDNNPFTSVNVRPSRDEVLKYYQKVALRYKLSTRLYTTVEQVEGENGNFSLFLSNGESINAQKVVFATGYFDHPNLLNVPGENLPHVTHYYDEGFAYTGTKALVVGGMNSAVETALDLFRNGAETTMVVREPELGDKIKPWIKPDIENRIKEGSVKAFFNTEIQEISEKQCTLKNNRDNSSHEEPADFVFLMTGYRPDAKFLRSAGIALDEETLIPQFDENTMESNREGIYLAGSALAGCKPSLVFIENGREHARVIMEKIGRG